MVCQMYAECMNTTMLVHLATRKYHCSGISGIMYPCVRGWTVAVARYRYNYQGTFLDFRLLYSCYNSTWWYRRSTTVPNLLIFLLPGRSLRDCSLQRQKVRRNMFCKQAGSCQAYANSSSQIQKWCIRLSQKQWAYFQNCLKVGFLDVKHIGMDNVCSNCTVYM